MLRAGHRRARAWLFDFDGTLTDYETADRSAVATLHQTSFTDVPLDEFYASSLRARTSFYRARADGQAADGLDQSRVAALCSQYERAGDTNRAVAVYREALLAETTAAIGAWELLQQLSQSFRLGIVTNAYDAGAQRTRIRATGLRQLVEVVVVAAEVGYFKPDPRIMTAASDALGVAPRECVYVGDSHEFDVVAASAAGMHPIYVGEEAAAADLPCFPDLESLRRSLREVGVGSTTVRVLARERAVAHDHHVTSGPEDQR